MPTRPAAGDSWRRALEGLLVPETAAAPAPRHTALALQLELREAIPRGGDRWNGPAARAARSGTEDLADLSLGVRPVTRTARGWARGSLTWSNLPYMLNRLGLDPAQHSWFCQFGALYRAAVPAVPGQDADWVLLDDFANPVLWTLLDQADALGIALVGSSAKTAVRRAGDARLSLDASRTAAGLRLTPALTLGEEAWPLERARAIADHGVYGFRLAAPARLVLAPAELGPEQRELLRPRSTVPHAVSIPPAGVGEFLSDYLPELRGRLEILSADGSVELPALPPPLLILTASFEARHTLALHWRWENTRRGAQAPALAAVLPEGTLPAEWLSGEDLPLPVSLRGMDAAECAATLLPRLEKLPGVRVDRRGTAPDYRELTGEPLLKISAVPTEKDDWFSLGVIVTVDGHDIPFVPLFKALAKGRRKLLLVDGSYLSLGHPAFQPLIELIRESQDLPEWEANPVISRYRVDLWAEFEDLAEQATPAREWRELLAAVAEGAAPAPVPLPAGIHAELRPYQEEGFAWLAFLWRHHLGGILADDMGLGKTLQCLALIRHAHDQRPGQAPFLVVAPTSVVSNWVAEAARFAPGLRVHEITATEARSGRPLAGLAAGADIIVTSYALLRLDFEAYQAIARDTGWSGLILDEAQFVKNAESRIHACALELDVRVKIAVTGTPLENSLTELHALLAIVTPGLFASARRFREEYVRPIERVAPGISTGIGAGRSEVAIGGARQLRLARLRRRVRPFMLRRVKEAVAADLPAKQEQVLRVELHPEHRALYDLFLQRERQKLFGLLEDLDRNRFIVFRSLTLLRLLALDPALLGEEHADVPAAKLDVLMDQLADVVAEGHRTLVFSQFTSYLALVARRLEAAGIAYAYLDGSTRKRSEVINGFKTGEAPVFLISLKAGGFGLNLTEADYVFLLDPWWNPASEEQAVDRTHRIGQSKNVFVYRMIAADTIEEKVMVLKQRKAALFDAVINDEELFSSALTAQDIRELLG